MLDKMMEKKKLLLVAVSVGVFLVIIISASILIFTPKTSRAGTAFSSSHPISAGTGGSVLPERQPATVDAADLVKNADGIRGIQTPPQANASQETNFYINGEQPNAARTVENGDHSRVTINIPKPATAAVPDAPAASQAVSQPVAAPAKPAVVVAAKPPTAAARPPAAAARPPAVVKANAGAGPAQSKTSSNYWVQTGAFSTQVRAEGAKEMLSAKGITSIIENRVVDGKTWYRVRVGPYTSENEAKYWLSLVKSIDGFGDSQVRQTLR